MKTSNLAGGIREKKRTLTQEVSWRTQWINDNLWWGTRAQPLAPGGVQASVWSPLLFPCQGHIYALNYHICVQLSPPHKRIINRYLRSSPWNSRSIHSTHSLRCLLRSTRRTSDSRCLKSTLKSSSRAGFSCPNDTPTRRKPVCQPWHFLFPQLHAQHHSKSLDVAS